MYRRDNWHSSTYIYIYLIKYICIWIHSDIDACICIYIYTYIHIHTHTPQRPFVIEVLNDHFQISILHPHVSFSWYFLYQIFGLLKIVKLLKILILHRQENSILQILLILIPVCISDFIRFCMYIYTYICTYIFIYIYIYIYIHIYINIEV
jgi:hypothetical protein